MQSRDFAQSQGAIKLSKRQKPRIRGNPRPVEFQLQPTVEIQPDDPGSTFTRRVSHPENPNQQLTS